MKASLLKHIILAMVLFFSLGSCASGPVGSVFFNYTQYPGEMAPDGKIVTTKTAEGCTYSVLGLVTWGNAGAGEIALNNGITKISVIDHHSTDVLWFGYREYCTIISGE